MNAKEVAEFINRNVSRDDPKFKHLKRLHIKLAPYKNLNITPYLEWIVYESPYCKDYREYTLTYFYTKGRDHLREIITLGCSEIDDHLFLREQALRELDSQSLSSTSLCFIWTIVDNDHDDMELRANVGEEFEKVCLLFYSLMDLFISDINKVIFYDL